MTLVGDDEFDVVGTIGFGSSNALRFRSVCRGRIGPAPEAGLRLGTAVCEIDGGSGELDAAVGWIASSFLVSETGELTDHQLALIFLEERGERR